LDLTAVAQAHAAAQRGDFATASALLDEAAARGDAAAAFELGSWRLGGFGAPRSLREAHRYFRRSAELGHPHGKSIERAFLATGTGAPRDWPKALELLEAAAADGEARAQRELALLVAMALGPEGDPKHVPAKEQVGSSPDVWIIRGLLTPDECRFLIDTAMPAFQPALVGHIAGRGAAQRVEQVRTCDVAAFPWVAESPAIHALNRRMAAASGTAVEAGEPLQVFRYRPGQQFKPHRDSTDDVDNQRVLTLLVYLNEGYSGGETQFLNSGLKVRGKTGDAVLFRNADERGRPDPNTLHAGLPVVSGEKFLASRWIRQKRFGPVD
jgi:prolyl 4-hydroxylase